MTVSGIPSLIASEAKLCRRSWSRTSFRPALARSLDDGRRTAAPQVSQRRTSELANFVARKQFVLDDVVKSNFIRAAMDNTDEYRVAKLLEAAPDVVSLPGQSMSNTCELIGAQG